MATFFMFDPNDSYYYSLLGTFGNAPGFDDPRLTRKLLYKFRTENKTVYHMIAEEYLSKYYFIKFYPSRYQDSKNGERYKIRTKVQPDASKVIGTCVKLVLELIKKNPDHYFGFFGQWDEVDVANNRKNSQRFQIYKRITTSYFRKDTFDHIEFRSINVFMIVSKNSVYLQKKSKLTDDVIDFLSRDTIESLVLPAMLEELLNETREGNSNN